jgi:hypothetical protein
VVFNAPLCEQLITESEVPPVVVYGRGNRFRLIPLTEPIDHETLMQDVTSGLRYVGLLVVVEGTPRMALRLDWTSHDIEAMRYASLAFTESITSPPAETDFITFAERLLSLPDTREVPRGA